MEDFEGRGDDASASDASDDGAGEGRGGAADAGASSADEGGRGAGPAAPGAQRPGLRPGKREAAAASAAAAAGKRRRRGGRGVEIEYEEEREDLARAPPQRGAAEW